MAKFNAVLFLTFLLGILSIFNLTAVWCQECGKKQNFARLPLGVGAFAIVGGQDAQLGEFPWQVSLQYSEGQENVHFCGGSVVTDKWVLTAAHCLTSGPFAKHRLVSSTFDAVAGIVDRSQTAESEQRIAVVDYFIHEDFNESMGRNDIALLELESSYNFGEFVSPICLPEPLQATAGLATVTGWGSITQGGPFSGLLQKLDMTIISNDDCKSYYPNKIVGSMICIQNGGGSSYTGPCAGDSGGPLIAVGPEGNSYYICGVVSWGNGCVENYPAVLMEVSFYIDWMNTIMNE